MEQHRQRPGKSQFEQRGIHGAAPQPVTVPGLIIESPVGAKSSSTINLRSNTPILGCGYRETHRTNRLADGFDPFVRRVTVVDGQTTTLKADLIEGGGTVEFQASISPATLILDDGDDLTDSPE